MTWPKLPSNWPELFVPWYPVETPLKFGWFQMLKKSARNWSLAFSWTGKVLNRAQFQSCSPGPRMIPLAQFPKNPKAGAANDPVLNHSDNDFEPGIDPTQLGRVANPPVPVAREGVSGAPLKYAVMPENCQLPNAFPVKPDLFRRIGSW